MLFYLITDYKPVPEVDLGFVISARAADAANNFVKIKDTINAILNEFGIGRVRYTVILYGVRPSVKVQFGDDFPSAKSLQSYISVLPRPRGGADLSKALQAAKGEFDKSVRPGAKRVLVVISDSKSDSLLVHIRNASKSLENSGVKVVPVAFGNAADKQELQSTSEDGKDYLVNAKEPVDGKALAEKIINQALVGKTRRRAFAKICVYEHNNNSFLVWVV